MAISGDFDDDEPAHGAQLVGWSSDLHHENFKNCVRKPCRFSLQTLSLSMTGVGVDWSFLRTNSSAQNVPIAMKMRRKRP